MRVSGNRRPRGGRSGSGNGRSGSSGGRSGSNNNRRSNSGNRSYDSNGPDGKIRGSASQVYEKYVTLARDTQTAGDPVAAENYFQHAEHYFRIMLANNLVKPEKNTDQEQAEEGSSEESGAEEASTVQGSDKNADGTEDRKQTDGVAADADEKPLVLDLSATNEGEADTVSPDEPDQVEDDASEDDAEKPKTKRRVSRTRGLRRRANRRTDTPSESDEPQTAE
ncbi:DUF4167 domain-containing protein [Sneathiella aquimaris]|uniref:DUF4167 domain-containing protein n=1 Tax=Sneathiella aquimaris TaxID=2599305 RepID=UPI00146D9126|nr:DUF4167 domain-containing protein [Sneathiella aquimaris]